MSKRNHKQISAQFVLWFQKQRPDWRIMANATGYASKEHVHYGTPPGDGKGHGGGGADYFAFGPGGKVEFYEVKTDGVPKLQKNQVVFHRNMTALGFNCFIVRGHDDGTFEVIPFSDYSKLKRNLK